MGAYFGQDVEVVVDRLLDEPLDYGGWNREAERGSTRGSFHTTICVLEGLLEYERATGGSAEVAAARVGGQGYLLDRRMFRRLSNGEVVDPAWTRFSFPTWWHDDGLRGLDHLRSAGAEPDERWAAAIELVESKRGDEGRWLLENPHPGRVHVEVDEGEGNPSRWNTLRALRVLDRYAQSGQTAGRPDAWVFDQRRNRRPSSERRRATARSASVQLHRSPCGTPASTCSTWAPHPAQAIF